MGLRSVPLWGAAVVLGRGRGRGRNRRHFGFTPDRHVVILAQIRMYSDLALLSEASMAAMRWAWMRWAGDIGASFPVWLMSCAGTSASSGNIKSVTDISLTAGGGIGEFCTSGWVLGWLADASPSVNREVSSIGSDLAVEGIGEF